MNADQTKSRTDENASSEPTTGLTPARTTSSSASRLVLELSILVVIVAVVVSSSGKLDQIVPGLGRVSQKITATWNSFTQQDSTTPENTPDKYTTDFVNVEPRVLLSNDQCSDLNYIPSPLSDGRIVPVTDVFDRSEFSSDKVFFMLNGRNEGVYMTWNGRFECLAGAAEAAAKWLGADTDEIDNGVRLYTPMGKAIRNAAELSGAKNMAHILLDFQLWQWPGIKLGYNYVLEDGVELTTVGLTPKVFDVEYFFSESEAREIIELGEPALNQSRISGYATNNFRTSHSAFLDESPIAMDFRRRSARIARLPSPSYAENLQLVRYEPGEFFRQHLDNFGTRDILPRTANAFTIQDYRAWAAWAADKLRSLDQSELPEDFREGGKHFPKPKDRRVFPNTFLDVFYHDAMNKNFFKARADDKWAEWIRTKVEKDASGTMVSFMNENNRPHYLPSAIRAWEDKLGRPELRYTLPKKPVSGVTHYLRWIRWLKERISFLGEEAPTSVGPSGPIFPTYTADFERLVLGFVLDDNSQEDLTQILTNKWHSRLTASREMNHVLLEALKILPQLAELAIRAWEKRVDSPLFHYKLPKYVRHFNPQRYVTLFLYLNNEIKIGGETVFPYSTERFTDEKVKRVGMDECSTGLAVPPRGLHASLFYVQTPEGDVDLLSRHGGCPPVEGVKWGANSFMWDSEAYEGARFWAR